MKKSFRFPWITSSALLSSLCCYSCILHAADTTVNKTIDDGSSGTLRYAINQANSGGGVITFAPGMAGQTITLSSNLPPLNAGSASPITINPTDVACTINGNQHQVFFAQNGNVDIQSLTITNAAAIGGGGGASTLAPSGSGTISGFGGGGAGLGGGLFVNNGATVEILNVYFINNRAQGGAGGRPLAVYYTRNGGGGGGGGCNYGLLATGGDGAHYDFDYYGNLLGGGGGGGGGSTEGGSGTASEPGSGGGSGHNLIFSGGAGGSPVITSYEGVTCSSNPEAGADCGGGGGGGGQNFYISPAYAHHRILSSCAEIPAAQGGFGGGGGGGGNISGDQSFLGSIKFGLGGDGGFGGGGGGGEAISISVFAGGQSDFNHHTYYPVGGGGGAGLGGAVFVRQGGSLTIYCDSGAATDFFSNNAVIGGDGGWGPRGGYGDGGGYGSDIFLNSGGTLTFHIDTAVTIAGSIASDGLIAGSGIVFQGAGDLTLSGNNSYNGGTTRSGGKLIVGSDANLGESSGPVTLTDATLQITSPLFTTSRAFSLTGTTNYITTASSAAFNGPLSGSSRIHFDGAGTTTLNGANQSYSGDIYLDAGTLVVSQTLGTGSQITFNAANTTLEFSGNVSVPHAISVDHDATIKADANMQAVLMGQISGAGSLTLSGPGALVLSANNDGYSGAITVNNNATIQIHSATNLGDGSNTISLAQGNLEFLPATTTTIHNPITISASGAGIINDAGTQVAFEGPVTCNGPLTINGGGNIFNDDFSGGGSLILTGTGTTIFAHKPVLTGGISVNTGTTYQINDLLPHSFDDQKEGADFFSLTSDLTNHGTLQFNNVSGTITQSVEGQGGLSFLGGGNIVLNASHVCTGGISIDSGYTVHAAIYDALPLAGPIDISDGATLVFEHTSGTANPAQVLGAGTLQMDSDFSLLLNDTNLHTGGNRLRSGTTIVSSDAGLGTGTTVLGYEDNAAELQLRSATLSVPITLQGEGADFSWTGTCFVSSAIGSYNATPLWVSIADGFEAAETGNVLHFSGTNSSTGSTTFENGTLFLENVTFEGAVTFYPDAVVTASGSVGGEIALGGLTNYGALHPDGSLTVYGDFQQGAAATLTFNVQAAGACDQMSVSQSVYANGGLVVNVDGGAYAVGQEITLLSAETHIYGSFTSISAPDFLRIDVDADPGIFGSVITQSILAGASAKGNNPKRVLQNLRDIEHTPGSDLIAVLNTMVGLSQAQLSDALDQLHPALFGAFDLLNANTNSLITSILARHPSEICCSHQADPCENLGGSVWVQPFGYFTHQDRIGEQMGFYANTVGLVGGGHYRYSSGLLFGAGVAYDSSDLSWHERRGQGHMRSASLAFYTDYTKKAFAVDASLIGSYDLFQATRKIDFSTVYRQAKHSKNGFNITFHVGGNGDFKTRKCDIKPFADVDYFYLDQQGFKETGAQSLNLHVHHYDSHLLRSEAGVRLARSYSMGEKGCFSPMIWLSGINECHLVKNHYKANFLGESPSFEVRTFNKPIYLISPGVELSFKVGPQFGLSVRYGAELNAKIATQKMDGRLEWFF